MHAGLKPARWILYAFTAGTGEPQWRFERGGESEACGGLGSGPAEDCNPGTRRRSHGIEKVSTACSTKRPGPLTESSFTEETSPAAMEK